MLLRRLRFRVDESESGSEPALVYRICVRLELDSTLRLAFSVGGGGGSPLLSSTGTVSVPQSS